MCSPKCTVLRLYKMYAETNSYIMYYCDRHDAIICDDQRQEHVLAEVHILESVCVVKTVWQMENAR